MGWVEAGVAKCGPGKEEEISLCLYCCGERGKLLTPTKTDAKIS